LGEKNYPKEMRVAATAKACDYQLQKEKITFDITKDYLRRKR